MADALWSGRRFRTFNVNDDFNRESLRIEQTEGAKFWMRVMTEIRGRGTTDILIAVVDGLKG
jgi:transposase-like protein